MKRKHIAYLRARKSEQEIMNRCANTLYFDLVDPHGCEIAKAKVLEENLFSLPDIDADDLVRLLRKVFPGRKIHQDREVNRDLGSPFLGFTVAA